MDYELGIIGAGNMAEAIARGITSAGVIEPGKIIASDVSPGRRDVFEQSLGVIAVESAVDVARSSKRLLLSVKPQQMADVLKGIEPAVATSTLVISIAAGVSTRSIEGGLANRGHHVIRTMPNLPMTVGLGVIAIAPGSKATEADLADARRLFAPSADVVDVREDQIDAVTAVSGSGPAYFFFLAEQMIAAGEQLGLSPEQAHRLATRTAAGAAKMLTESTDSPADLRRKVTSPGGTTFAAISLMQERGVDSAIVDALKAADRRSKELGR